MQYRSSLPFHGDPVEAFGLAETALTALGFRITERSPSSVRFDGPGMHSTRQSPLLGASRLRLVVGPNEIAMDAELGGAARMARFVRLFPIGLIAGIGILLSVVFFLVFGPGIWITVVGGALSANAALWLFLAPLMARGIRTRTERALDTLLANLVSVGNS